MQIILNGQPHTPTLPADGGALLVSALVGQLGWDLQKVAVERNGTIVPRSLHGATAIMDGDRVEVVHFIGGG